MPKRALWQEEEAKKEPRDLGSDREAGGMKFPMPANQGASLGAGCPSPRPQTAAPRAPGW